MIRIIQTIKNTQTCFICGKRPEVAFNRPKSLHKTKKLVYPNLQKYHGQWVCTSCLKTILKK